jgi:hypothetical protein
MRNTLSKLAKVYKKLHKWPGLIISVILLYYSTTGIFMNHREFFSGIDVSRTILPENFHYSNWNNGAIKGQLILSKDSILFYGNIGIWLTDSSFKDYKSFNRGFPKGMDNRKIYDVHRSSNGDLYAATHFGLFAYNKEIREWEKFHLNIDIKRFVAIESIADTIYALNRSYLFKGKTNACKTIFQKIELEKPLYYKNEVSLFETIWQIHSGEIFGLPGKLWVDLMGIITFFLSITGIIYFFFPGWIKKRKKKSKTTKRLIKLNRWSLKWHNHLGAWTFAGLIILFGTGMFLRPPLLIAIAKSDVPVIKFTHLNQSNPWNDKLRDIIYDKEKKIFLLSTSEGIFFMSKDKLQACKYEIQPPISVMGITTLKPVSGGTYMIGSFSGLFLWNPLHSEIFNYAQGSIFQGIPSGRPIGDYKVTGYFRDIEGNEYMVDYDKGVIPLYHKKKFPEMPDNVLKESKMSLWNLSLEIHTGRFFQNLIAGFYILIVPLTGLTSIIVVLSGYLLWRKQYKKNNKP